MIGSHRWLVVVGVIALGGGCNCGKKGSGGSSGGGGLLGESGIPTMPAQLNFGNVAVGQTARLQLVLSNSGSGALDIDTQKVSGPPFSESSALLGTSVAPGAKTHAIIAFTPTQAGPASGTFTLETDGDPATATVALVGVGLELDVSATPASLSFGQVPVGTTAPTQTVTFLNTTTAPLYIEVSAAGTASEYAVTDPTGSPVTGAAVQLMPNTPYVVTVAFSPDKVSIFNSSFALTVCQNAQATVCLAPQAIALSGQGVTGTLTLSPNPISFNGVPDGTSANQTVTVTNTGSAAADVTCIYLQSEGASACGTASSFFTLGAPSVSLPDTLAAGASFTFPLTFNSSGASTVTDVLEVAYIPQGLAVSSTATDDISASQNPSPCTLTIVPGSLSFTYSTVGTPITESTTLTNTGGSSCSVTGIEIDPTSDPDYSLASGQPVTLTLAAGASATIGVTFDLASAGVPSTRLGHLDFQSTDPAHASVQLPLQASGTTPYAGNGAWPRWHHDNTQSGLTASDTSWLAGTIAWTADVGAPGLNYFTQIPNDYMNSPVVDSSGNIYQLGMNGTLYCLNSSGVPQWGTALEGPVVDPHPGTPIIASDGTLYVAFGDTVEASYPSGMFHISSAGAILQAIPPSGSGDGFDLPPMLTNGGLLLGADDEAANQGYSTGAFAFSISGTINLVNSTATNATDDQVSAVVGSDDSTYWCGGGICDALSPPASGFGESSGWPTTPGNTCSSTSDLALDELFTGNLMIVMGGWTAFENSCANMGITNTNTSRSQLLVSVTPGGKTVWTVTLPGPSAAQASADPNYGGIADSTVGNSCPAIGTDGTVYVGNFDGLHAINGTTGQENSGWPFLTGSDNVMTAPAIGGDGTIFFGTAGGKFYAVNPDGSQRFMVSAGGRIAGSPAIGPSGAVYFVADDGYLYAVN